MKKMYQTPETDVVNLNTTGILQEGTTEASGIGHVIQGNENKSFEEEVLPTDMNKSLWED